MEEQREGHMKEEEQLKKNRGKGAPVEERNGINLTEIVFNTGNFFSPYTLLGGLLVFLERK